jgi:hypothetical protein
MNRLIGLGIAMVLTGALVGDAQACRKAKQKHKKAEVCQSVMDNDNAVEDNKTIDRSTESLSDKKEPTEESVIPVTAEEKKMWEQLLKMGYKQESYKILFEDATASERKKLFEEAKDAFNKATMEATREEELKAKAASDQKRKDEADKAKKE